MVFSSVLHEYLVEVLEAVIVTLMYGVKSVYAQSKEAIIKLAKDFQQMYPALAELLLTGRYADDIADSKASNEEIKQLVKYAEAVFKTVKISCEGLGGKFTIYNCSIALMFHLPHGR